VAGVSVPAAWVPLHGGWYVPRLVGFGLGRKPVEGDVTDVELYGEQPGYLSPEQAWGRGREIGPTADVYGLGAILYHLLAGRPPFKGPTVADVLDAVQTAPLIPPADVRTVPDDLDAICRKCLQRQPRRRYATAGDLADDLRRTLMLLPIRARIPSGAARLGKWVRRRPARAALLLACVLGGVGTVGGYVVGVGEGDLTARERADLRLRIMAAEKDASHLRAQLAQRQPQERFDEYRQQLAQAARELAAGQLEQAMQTLDGCAPELRRFEWEYLRQRVRERAGGQDSAPLTMPGPVSHLAFNRVSRHLAIAANDPGGKGRVRVWDTRKGQTVAELTDLPGPVHAVAFSPNGKYVAAAGGGERDQGGELRVWSLVRGPWHGSVVVRRTVGTARLTDLVYRPQGDVLFAAEGSGTLLRLAAADGSTRQTFGRPVFGFAANRTTRLALSPQGERLATFTSGESTVRLWDTAQGALGGQVSGPGAVRGVALAGRLAVAHADNTVQVYPPELPGQAPVPEASMSPPGAVRGLALSPDGRRLALALADGTVRIWAPGGGDWVELLRIPTNGTAGLLFTPSGRGLATAGGKDVRFWGDLAE
jgi:hypothetical protein